ncbi:MFS transporter [Allokutzneria albata]|uniref:Predicted arabinose efflux permease, MFS family n=1 Tax=Allokutzneria albata TaxID=211114 RepID=A0A1G9VEA7_ALLAB|nr:MFS transporter [Allokutzneria albata]SDM70430.1 Predicted arabinose efflux permease, MFS family [Allokutzneria albata]
MTASSSRARRLAGTLYAYMFAGSLVLLYPVYSLLFVDTGLSVAEISSLFVIWCVAALVLEVPSGAWADTFSRRWLLALGPLCAGAGYALWIAFPSYWAFLLGFVLWGVENALTSGSLEALVYEELDRLGAADRYARVMGRARAASQFAIVLAMAFAGPVLALGGYETVGVASVLACVAAAGIALLLPEHRVRTEKDEPGYFVTLRLGLREARVDPAVRRTLLVLPFVMGVWDALEEYVPLLSLEKGVAPTAVPWVMLLIWLGVTSGGLLAPLGERLATKGISGLLALGAFALGAGALLDSFAGFFLLALGFCAFQLASVVLGARLQENITGPSRATVTSLAGLGVGVLTVLLYGTYAAASAGMSQGAIFAMFAVPYLVLAVALAAGERRPARVQQSAVRVRS